jgi:hypothetical protein
MRPLTFVLCAVLLLPALGCSFNRAWKRAATAPVPADEITGAWEGSWVSEVNQHHGRLRALLTKDEAGIYQARFQATFLRVLSAGYTVPLQAARQDGEFQLEGEQDLGWLSGGVYRYDGKASPTNFFCTYRSKKDHGTFRMTRPQQAAGLPQLDPSNAR